MSENYLSTDKASYPKRLGPSSRWLRQLQIWHTWHTLTIRSKRKGLENMVVLVICGDEMGDTIQSSRMYRHYWSFNAAITSFGVSTHISKWREVSLERNVLVLQSQTMETQLYLNCSCTTPSHPKGNMFIRHCKDKNDMLIIFLHIHC